MVEAAWGAADGIADTLTARLAVGLTHDFRNYLLGIVGFAELAGSALPDDHPAHAHVRSVEALAAAATDVVTHLLELARSGEDPRPLDLARRLRTLILTLDRATPPMVRLTCEAPEALRAFALPALVNQAVANLVLNAADALPSSGGTVSVRLGSRMDADGAQSVVIEVADDGPGISPVVVRHLFERGFTTKRGGCGLGLPLVDAIATAHGGRVEVESVPDHGSTFRIVIPHIPAAVEEVAAVEASSA